ncbi:Regulatory protein, FmdB family [uncultured delta proteobacterium]|uniref:Regulatory protein, FmdB family n=1 Tax=uncultured delta proteobacterium TaxID=34034 RepID=A0A212J9J3_9DELT|nr:Regulatory protein, FmdB family [uncultured delta proteobacterium]
MPIYEYRCTKCGNDFEEILGAGDPAPACPSCHSAKTEKLLSKASFRTGSGACCESGGCETGAARASSGCAGCSGGSCATCH